MHHSACHTAYTRPRAHPRTNAHCTCGTGRMGRGTRATGSKASGQGTACGQAFPFNPPQSLSIPLHPLQSPSIPHPLQSSSIPFNPSPSPSIPFRPHGRRLSGRVQEGQTQWRRCLHVRLGRFWYVQGEVQGGGGASPLKRVSSQT